MQKNTTCFYNKKRELLGCAADFPNVVLQKGFVVTKGNQKYEVTDWHYCLSQEDDTPNELRVVLGEIKTPWFAQTEERQVWVGHLLVSPTIAVVLLVAVLYFYQPVTLWAIIGRIIRGTVLWGLLITGPFLATQIKGGPGSSRPTLLGTYFAFLLTPLSIFLAILWSEVSRPPEPLSVWPDDYLAYLQFLQEKFRRIWPVILSVIPWLVFLLNLLGIKGVSKLLELVGKQAQR